MILNETIMTYLTNLSLLSSLDIDNFSDNDEDITQYIPKCITDSVAILGTEFDEKLSIFLQESRRLINICYKNKIMNIELPIYFSEVYINTLLGKVYDASANISEFNLDKDKLMADIEEASDKFLNPLRDNIFTTQYSSLNTLVDYMESMIDKTYHLSRDLSRWTIDKINHSYYNGKEDLEKITFYAIEFIVYLIKYYFIIHSIFDFIIRQFNKKVHDKKEITLKK